jgi:hypothetical protein
VTEQLRSAGQWRSYLKEYSIDVLRVADDEDLDDLSDAQRTAEWLGYPGASAEWLTALDSRLGARLPPSYRSFLEASDGWLHIGPFMWSMRTTDTVGWLRDADPETWRVIRGGDGEPWDDIEFMDRVLLVSGEGDAQYWLLDPGDTAPDGEWAAYVWASWYPGLGERHASFADLVRAERTSFEELKGRDGRGVRPDGVEELLAQGRVLALRGEVTSAIASYEEAAVKGSGSGAYLAVILGAFLDRTHLHHAIRNGILGRPHVIEAIGVEQVRAEAVPLYLRGLARYGGARAYLPLLGDVLPRIAGDERADWPARAAAFVPPTLPEPPEFQRALDLARTLAGRGRTDESWSVLEAAIPHWHSDSAHRIAPVILLTDPTLRDVVTPGRARQVVMTPRGSAAARAQAPRP